MSIRLQVLIAPELDGRVQKAAQRNRISKGEWVRRAIELSLGAGGMSEVDSVARLSALNAPTADIGKMLTEIDAGRETL